MKRRNLAIWYVIFKRRDGTHFATEVKNGCWMNEARPSAYRKLKLEKRERINEIEVVAVIRKTW